MKTFAFIDASNLFYGGEKSLGWKIDYRKFLNYLTEKYDIEKAFYFGGVEIHDFTYDYQVPKTPHDINSLNFSTALSTNLSPTSPQLKYFLYSSGDTNMISVTLPAGSLTKGPYASIVQTYLN